MNGWAWSTIAAGVGAVLLLVFVTGHNVGYSSGERDGIAQRQAYHDAMWAQMRSLGLCEFGTRLRDEMMCKGEK